MSEIQTLITENLDLWTSSIKAKSDSGRGSSKKTELYGVKKLRELILELAVRGKLVPQDPNDEAASKLLERIAAEKEQLIKDKKIKKVKITAIQEDNDLFSIPSNWVWTQLNNVYDVRDGTHDSPKYLEHGYPLVTSKNLSSGQLDLSNVKYISEEDYIKINERSAVERNDVLFAMIGSIGNPVIININPIFSVKNVGLFKYYSSKLSNPKYLKYFLEYASKKMKAKSSGGVQPFISLGNLRAFEFPLPPLEEQQRIVAKVNELMALCDQIEQQSENSLSSHQHLVENLLATLTQSQTADELAQNWARISEHFDTLLTTETSIESLKQTILQLAVMGKLVEQDPEDEPASKLLERIAAEKELLIKEKKIKKQKPLPEITDEEKPFDLPRGWEWVTLNALLPQFQNGISSRGDANGEPITVLRLADIKNWLISFEDTRSLLISSDSAKRYSLKIGDSLIIRVNGSSDIVGRFITCKENYDAIYCDHFIRMRFPIESLHPEYLSILGSSSLIRDKIANLFITTAGQKTVNQGHISSLIFPLSPLSEQHRIVTKVNELMALCDKLKQDLQAQQQTQLLLTDALIDQALS